MRRLSVKEIVLLVILGVIALIAAYVMFFYMPTSERITTLDEQIGETQDQILESQMKLAKQKQMQQELEEMLSQENPPSSIPTYDNIKAVMVELNGILQQTGEYSLSAGTVNTDEAIVRRTISLRYTSSSYSEAKKVLQNLHDSRYRCMIDGLEITLDTKSDDVSVSATLIFFEYQENYQPPVTEEDAA